MSAPGFATDIEAASVGIAGGLGATVLSLSQAVSAAAPISANEESRRVERSKAIKVEIIVGVLVMYRSTESGGTRLVRGWRGSAIDNQRATLTTEPSFSLLFDHRGVSDRKLALAAATFSG